MRNSLGVAGRFGPSLEFEFDLVQVGTEWALQAAARRRWHGREVPHRCDCETGSSGEWTASAFLRTGGKLRCLRDLDPLLWCARSIAIKMIIE